MMKLTQSLFLILSFIAFSCKDSTQEDNTDPKPSDPAEAGNIQPEAEFTEFQLTEFAH